VLFPLESDVLVPTGSLIVLFALLVMLVVFGAVIVLLLRFLVGRRETGRQGQEGNDSSRL
jgi:hypothetical protein